MVYFDNAATTYPKPDTVSRAVYQSFEKYGANPGRSGHSFSLQTAKMVYSCREEFARFFGIPDCENVIFTKNCTESLNIALKGIMQSGGHVIISSFEHNSVVRPLEYLQQAGICQYSVANIYENDPERTIYGFEKLIRPSTKMIFCTHASNVTGVILPVSQLSLLAHSRGMLFGMDAAQTAGILPIHMLEMGIDVLCCAGHKGLMGPTGTGVLLIRDTGLVDELMQGGTGSSSNNLNQPDFSPDKFESGTLNTIGIAGMRAGLAHINKIGLKRIYQHELQLAQMLYDGLEKCPKVILYTRRPEYQKHVGVVCFNVQGYTSVECTEALNVRGFALRGGYQCSPLTHDFFRTKNTGVVRASMGMYNNANQINGLIAAVKLL